MALIQSVYVGSVHRFSETTPTQVAALVVVTVIRAGDVTVAVLVLVSIGAYVVSAGNNCCG